MKYIENADRPPPPFGEFLDRIHVGWHGSRPVANSNFYEWLRCVCVGMSQYYTSRKSRSPGVFSPGTRRKGLKIKKISVVDGGLGTAARAWRASARLKITSPRSRARAYAFIRKTAAANERATDGCQRVARRSQF